MGFSPLPPRLSIAEVLRTADSVSRHADAALMVLDMPWAALLADTSAALLVRRDQLPLAGCSGSTGCRSSPPGAGERARSQRRGGGARRRSAGRSPSPPCSARIASSSSPSTASSTRLARHRRGDEPHPRRIEAALYSALVTMSNAAAAQLRTTGSTTKLMVSVQVDIAWGRLTGGGGTFVGIAARPDRLPVRRGARAVVVSVSRRVHDARAAPARLLLASRERLARSR